MNKSKIRALVMISIVLGLMVILAIFNLKHNPQDMFFSQNGLYFDTVVTITVFNSDDAKYLDDCLNMCDDYEKMLSRTVPGSDIWRINHAGGENVEVSNETAYLIQSSIEYCEMTDGRVDITVAPLDDLWNFTGENSDGVPPSKAQIDNALKHVDYHNVRVEGNMVRLEDKDAAIDLGFIAKGYIADRIKEYLVRNGVKSGIISLGGNVAVIGSKPDGTGYKVGIRKPFGMSSEYVESLEVTDQSIVTSGTYERYFEYKDEIYHHILDAKTGYPVKSSFNSVTICSKDSMTADALSTVCFIVGEDEAKNIKEKFGVYDILFY